jgi:hypothetical protein
MLTWVGTFRTPDGTLRKVIIGKSEHPFLKHIGLDTPEKFVAPQDFSRLPAFRITGRNPVEHWCKLVSWEELEE